MSTIFNTSQLLGKGAKRRINHTYCDLLAVTKVPSIVSFGTTDTLGFSNGVIEINGNPFDFNESIDFSALGSLVQSGKYIVAAVPGYLEPADVNAATAAGVNYYTYNDSKRQTFLKTFLDPEVQTRIEALGGCSALTQKVFSGCATDEEIQAFNDYHAARKKIIDPRCTIKTLRPNGLRLVLIQIQDQDNFASCNGLKGMTECEFKNLQARVGELCVDRSLTTPLDIISDYNSVGLNHLIKSVTTYVDQADFDAGAAGSGGTVRPAPFNMSIAVSDGDTFAVLETYSYPSTTPAGHEGNEPKILNLLSYEKSELLGRINPIYLESDAPNAGICKPGASRLTPYGDPLPLVVVEFDAAGSVITIVKEIYASYTSNLGA